MLALTLVGADDVTELSAHLEFVVPSTFGVSIATTLAGVTSGALLFAFTSGRVLTAHGVG